MKKRVFQYTIFIVLILFMCCKSKNESSIEVINSPTEEGEVTDEPKYQSNEEVTDVLSEAVGDLNKDGIDEKVVVKNTEEIGDFGIVREILIYKWLDESWLLWHTSTGAVLPSEQGGMMGDPFEGVTIERGCIVFKHFGGSRDKWNYTHRFRFQNNDWELIGTTVVYGAPCDQWKTLDYNLSNGDVVYTLEYDDCGGESYPKGVNKFNQPIQSPFLMDGYPIGENYIVVMDDDERMYF